MKREDLLKSPEYWLTKWQCELFRHIKEYQTNNSLTEDELAEKCGVTRSCICDVLKGEFNSNLGKLIRISLAIGKIPVIQFKNLEKYIENDIKKYES